jgi:MerR family copper efflux transcriptional regulator
MAPRPPDIHPARALTTALLCTTAQVTRGQLRIYEQQGLIAAPRRTAAGYRDYAPDTAARLQAIRQLKDIGFTLAEIALLLAESDEGQIDVPAVRELARQQLRSIDERIARLQLVRRYAAALAAGDMSALNDPECGFLVQFLMAGSKATRRRRA